MSIWDWSVAADLNATADAELPVLDGASARAYPGFIRSVMAALAAFAADQGGCNAVQQDGNEYVATTSAGLVTPRLGIGLIVRPDAANTAEVSLNVDGTGPKSWRDANGAEYTPGALMAGRFYRVAYDDTADAWRTVGV